MHAVDQDWPSAPDDNIYASELCMGDNFVVLAERDNSKGIDFFILHCTNWMHVVHEESRIDAWGITVEREDKVVEGYYYKHQSVKENAYIFLNESSNATIHSHLVC